MDIKKSFDALVREVELEKEEAARLLAEAKRTKDEADASKVESEMIKTEALKAIAELAEYKKTKEYVEGLTEVEKEIMDKKTEASIKHNELVRWENKLVEIETRQEAKEKELTKREADQRVREKTYKETLQKEFIEDLKKKF